ncbi:DUF1697 domain-containing protein [Alkalibacterium olivapovliticus]|uniref:Uncharacterized protein (DUF1697 family) n=1 Tax=Alkalibacterium olivapovliticus TaxID=99907 RepID=A0A2T0W832_9LACT|nr:DUF1697 domain-containing protein [Alkalibacterium olivapovliticus]PRY82842.1 uncharacterized protein (DUF1697 family) [Alkalibacterium olivapovliticus]
MDYVALLRGINVGGKNKVSMPELKRSVERVGVRGVRTYINTGNVIFNLPADNKSEFKDNIAEVIYEDFGLKLDILIRSRSEMSTLMAEVPELWTNDKQMKCDVLFLFEEVDTPSIIGELSIVPAIDTVFYVPGAVIWSVDRKNVTKSGLMKLAGSRLYKKMTIRNINTTRRLVSLMNEGLKDESPYN